MFNQSEIREILRDKVQAAGSISQWCRDNNVDIAYVSKALSGADFGGKTLLALGYKKQVNVVFVPLQQGGGVQ